MMTTWLPTTQSWATWLEAMTRQWLPTRVSWPSRVARWMVTYSRIAVSSPMVTPTGRPSRYLRSCGTPPMIAPWSMRQRAPMATRPSRTTWAPPSLSGQHGPAADPARARHAHLADQDHVLTDIAVVAYLHEVVDLRAAPHDGRAHGGAVDGGVRSDLDIVLDDESSHLRDLLVGGSVERIAESI